MSNFEAYIDRTRLEQVRQGAVLVPGVDAAIFEVTGPGALDCIQGLLTNDILNPGDQSVVYGALLTPKGMIVADYWVLRHGGALTMIAPAQARAVSVALFVKQLPPRLATVVDQSDRWSVVWLYGAGAIAATLRAGLISETPVPGRLAAGLGGGDAILVGRPGPAAPFALLLTGPAGAVEAATEALARVGAVQGGEAELLAARVIGGWPALTGEIDDKTLPQEVRYDEIDGVSYTKGCYTGQETVARIHFRGHPNRELRGILWLGAEPLEGRAVVTTAGQGERLEDGRVEREVGTVRSVLHLPDRVLGLAVIRREVPPGRTVTAAGRPAEVVALPFGEEHLNL